MARADQVFHLREAEKELGFAQAVRSGNTLFVSGTCAPERDRSGGQDGGVDRVDPSKRAGERFRERKCGGEPRD